MSLRHAFLASLFLVVPVSASLAGGVETPGEGVVFAEDATQRLVFDEDFATGVDRWEILDPATWRHDPAPEGVLCITARKSAYRPPHRSPYHVALVRDVVVDDFTLTFRVKSLLDTGPHRDCCVFFAYEGPARFYYVHLGAKPDPHSGQIMIVDNADRTAITTNVTPVPWTDGWHTVRVTREAASGRIRVYFDDLETPIMEAVDTRLGPGRVGLGSFDDIDAFDDVVLTTPAAEPN